MSRIIIELNGNDRFGAPLYICYHEAGGIFGSGNSWEMALADLLDKENELLPTSAERDVEDQINETH